MHWDYCHRTLRLSDLKCCKSSHSIPFTDANWSDGTAGLQMILLGPSSFPRKTCRATDSLNGKVTSKRFRKNTSNYRGWTHPRPPLTRCVDLKSCRIYQNPKLKNSGIPGSGTQTKDVSHLNRHKPTNNQHFTTLRVIDAWNKERKNQSHNQIRPSCGGLCARIDLSKKHIRNAKTCCLTSQKNCHSSIHVIVPGHHDGTSKEHGLAMV